MSFDKDYTKVLMFTHGTEIVKSNDPKSSTLSETSPDFYVCAVQVF